MWWQQKKNHRDGQNQAELLYCAPNYEEGGLCELEESAAARPIEPVEEPKAASKCLSHTMSCRVKDTAEGVRIEAQIPEVIVRAWHRCRFFKNQEEGLSTGAETSRCSRRRSKSSSTKRTSSKPAPRRRVSSARISRNTATSKQLSTSWLKLLMKLGQELVDTIELQVSPHSLATMASTTTSSEKSQAGAR